MTEAGDEIEVSLDPARLDRELVHRELAASYWSPGVRREVVERSIAGSLVAGAYRREAGAQVGYARLVTDHATFAWLCDVFVLPAWRGRGLARRLSRALIGQPSLVTVRRFVLATRDAHGVYAPLGFAATDPTRWMERSSPPSAWQEIDPAP